MKLNSERCHRRIRDLLPGAIGLRDQIRTHTQARLRRGCLQLVPHLHKGTQGTSRPGFADFTEQPVLNRVPFGRARWIMAHRHRQSQRIRYLDLPVLFPGPRPCPIAPATIGNNPQMVGIRIAFP